MGDHRRLSHSAFYFVLEEFFTKTDGNAATYGLTQGLVDDIKVMKNDLKADLDDQTLKQAASKAATTKTNGTRKTTDDLYAKAKRDAKNSGTAADKLAEIGFAPDDLTPTPIGVIAPIELSVVGFSNGKNSLVFNRNGNKPGTIYNAEAKIGTATSFVIIGFTKSRTFDHKNQTPGVKVVYRLRAQRGEVFSDYSNEAVVYND